MSHPILDIENWRKIKLNENLNISYNERVQYTGLKIDVPKFYFYLKERFGSPNVDYNSISQFFQEKGVNIGKVWCFVFQVDSNFVLISGDNLINISVLSINEPPEKIDFDIFCTNINKVLENKSLEKYQINSYNIFINYSFYLDNLIKKFKEQTIDERTSNPPTTLFLHPDEFDKQDNEINYKKFEYSREYNKWLSTVLEKATLTLQIQILLPIYFESIVDLAFRIKLKKSLYNNEQKYLIGNRKWDIFNYFERLPLYKKLDEIKEKCFDVDEKRVRDIEKYFNQASTTNKRNKLLHGNSLFFKNLNLTYYLDTESLIGFPDRHNAFRVVAESIHSSVLNSELNEEIEKYKKMCDSLVGIFSDNGYFKTLVSGIAFGHNSNSGGSISIGLNSFDDLFIPKD